MQSRMFRCIGPVKIVVFLSDIAKILIVELKIGDSILLGQKDARPKTMLASYRETEKSRNPQSL